MRQLHLQLYGRTEKSGFSEQVSSRNTVTLSPELQTVELELKAAKGEKFVELRFDPDNEPSSFLLHSLRIKCSSGSEIYRWNGTVEELRLTDIEASATHGDVILMSQSSDPFLLLPLASPQDDNLILEVTVSQDLSKVFIKDANTGFASLCAHQRELGDAIRHLQYFLSRTLDGFSGDLDGVQDALVTHHNHNHSEIRSLGERLLQVADRIAGFENKLQASIDAHADAATKYRNAMLAEIRDDWRALSAQLESSAQASSKEARERDAAFADRIAGFENKLQASIDAHADAATEYRNAILVEIRDDWRALGTQLESSAQASSKEARERDAAHSAARAEEYRDLTAAIHGFAKSHEIMIQIRTELGVYRDEDVIPKLKELKAEAEEVAKRQHTWLWRVARPLSERSGRKDAAS